MVDRTVIPAWQVQSEPQQQKQQHHLNQQKINQVGCGYPEHLLHEFPKGTGQTVLADFREHAS